MMVLADRTYIAGDHRAEQTLAARKDLRLDHGRVETADPSGAAALRLLLSTEAKALTTCVPRRGREGHLMMRAARIGEHRDLALFGIQFWIADDSFAVEWPDFGPIFGFTTAEASIVRQLLEGATGEAIATGMGISINTVRTHISHVYEKLGISSREQLWRRLAPYRID
jgi:DNA-binding CsgD family transcriptional regulator